MISAAHRGRRGAVGVGRHGGVGGDALEAASNSAGAYFNAGKRYWAGGGARGRRRAVGVGRHVGVGTFLKQTDRAIFFCKMLKKGTF